MGQIENSPLVHPHAVCARCQIATVPLSAQHWPDAMTEGEKWDAITRELVSANWTIGRDGEGHRVAVCPACAAAAQDKAAGKMLAPYRADTRCAKCGHDDLVIRHCTGRDGSCDTGPIGHLHWTCGRCRWAWASWPRDAGSPRRILYSMAGWLAGLVRRAQDE